MRLELKVIRWQNFLSYGNQFQEVQLNSHKTTLITGQNGYGKSTLIEAISFALFGKPFRNINKPQLQNSITKKNCLVELEFSIGGHEFVVRRGQNPNVFEIYKDDELINLTADIRDYQEAFEKYIIRINHKTFCQIVMLGSAIFKPFMTLPAADRRNVIEDLLDYKIFSVMNTLLSKKITDTEKATASAQKEKELLEERIKLTENHIRELNDNNDKLIADKTEQLNALKNDISKNKELIQAHVATITDLSGQIIDETKFKKLLKQANDLDYKFEMKREDADKDIEFFKLNTSCPTCHQNIADDHKQGIIHKCEEKKAKMLAAQEKLSVKIDEFQEALKKIGAIQQVITDNNQKIRDLEKANQYYNYTISQLNKEIETLSKKREEYDSSQLTEWRVQKDSVQQQLTSLNEQRYTMGIAANLLKDSGIKSKMIKTYIPVINQLIQKYLAILDFFVEFKLDEQFKEHIKSRNRDSFSYESFSQGEKARIDLALLFTWRSLAKIRGSVDINLIIFDEVLDSSVDLEGIDNIFKLIKDPTLNNNIIVISHREGISEDKFDRVLRVKKQKNFSRMLEA